MRVMVIPSYLPNYQANWECFLLILESTSFGLGFPKWWIIDIRHSDVELLKIYKRELWNMKLILGSPSWDSFGILHLTVLRILASILSFHSLFNAYLLTEYILEVQIIYVSSYILFIYIVGHHKKTFFPFYPSSKDFRLPVSCREVRMRESAKKNIKILRKTCCKRRMNTFKMGSNFCSTTTQFDIHMHIWDVRVSDEQQENPRSRNALSLPPS